MQTRNFFSKCTIISLFTCSFLIFQPLIKNPDIQSRAWGGDNGWSSVNPQRRTPPSGGDNGRGSVNGSDYYSETGVRSDTIDINRKPKPFVATPSLPSNSTPVGFTVVVTAPTSKMPDPNATISTICKFFGYTTTNETLECLLGSLLGVDIIIEVTKPDEIFTRLSKFAGKKPISVLYILGHGSVSAPHIALTTGTSLDPADVDVLAMQDKARELLKEIKTIEEKYCSLMSKKSITDEDRDILENLKDNHYTSAYSLAELKESLKCLASVGDVMASKGVIQLLNCSGAASKHHIEFLENIGRVFMWKHGGSVWASTTDIGVGQVAGINWRLQKLDQLTASIRSGRNVKPGDFYMVGNWQQYPIAKGPLFDDKLMAKLEKFRINKNGETLYPMPKCPPIDTITETVEVKTKTREGGAWVLNKVIKVDRASTYKHQCYTYSNSMSRGSWQLSRSGCDTGPQSGSGSYTVPPQTLIPGETIKLTAFAEGTVVGYHTSIGTAFYYPATDLSFDEFGSPNLSSNWSTKIASDWVLDEKKSDTGDFLIGGNDKFNKDGALLIYAVGSPGNAVLSMTYLFLYKWNE
jgi:hypothetical protein